MEACMFRKDTPVTQPSPSAPPPASVHSHHPPVHQRIETVIGDGTKVSGEVTVDGDLRVNGEVDGQITTSHTLIVGKTGLVKADIEAGSAEIAGRVVGRVSAQERVVLLGGSRLEGDVQASSFKIEDGAFFQGNCVMGGGRRSADDPAPKIRLAEGAKVSG
jgi:cytoskeletal protein CcmA (bactofilin family)